MLGAVRAKLAAARDDLARQGIVDPQAALERLTPEEQAVHAASIAGDRRTLVADAAVPAAMAVIYLGLLVYFRSIGGYRIIRLTEDAEAGDRMPVTTMSGDR